MLRKILTVFRVVVYSTGTLLNVCQHRKLLCFNVISTIFVGVADGRAVRPRTALPKRCYARQRIVALKRYTLGRTRNAPTCSTKCKYGHRLLARRIFLPSPNTYARRLTVRSRLGLDYARRGARAGEYFGIVVFAWFSS